MDNGQCYERCCNPASMKQSIIEILERIARAQEGMLAIAAEARQERMKLSAKLQEKLQQPFEGK